LRGGLSGGRPILWLFRKKKKTKRKSGEEGGGQHAGSEMAGRFFLESRGATILEYQKRTLEGEE